MSWDKVSPNITWTSVEPIYQHAPAKVTSSQNARWLYNLQHGICKPSHLKWEQNQQLCWTSCWWCRHTHFLMKLGQKFSYKCLQSRNNFGQIFLSDHILCMLTSCLKCSLLSKALSLVFKLFSCVELICYSNCIYHIDHK